MNTTKYPGQTQFNTTLTPRHRAILKAYTTQEGVSIAEAVRRALELLEKQLAKPIDKIV